MESVPKIVRERLQRVGASTHPDANLLAAFSEKSLTQREQSQVLDHLAGCALCREIVALSQPEAMQPAVAVPARATSWFQGRILQWGALAACIAVAGTFVLLRQQRKEKSPVLMASKVDAITAVPERSQAKNEEEPRAKKLEDRQIPKSETVLVLADKGDRKEQYGFEKQRITARDLDSSRAFAMRSAPKGGPVSAGASVMTAAAAPVAPPPPPPSSIVLQKSADEEADKKVAIGDKTQSAPATVNETVTVETATPTVTVEAESAPTKTKITALKPGVAGAAGKLAAQRENSYADDGKASMLRSAIAFPKPRWQLSPEGRVLRSLNLGETWQPVTVAKDVVFRALCVTGPEVWVGGSKGNLFYSSDAGEHWEQIKPSTDGQTLTADISGIEFADPQHGKVTTTNHQTWITSDGGHNWHKQ
jgi:hypothetical protein